MEFNFTEDQRLLQETVRDFLAGECTVDFVRGQWETETGRSPEFWARLAELVGRRRALKWLAIPTLAPVPPTSAKASAWTSSDRLIAHDNKGRPHAACPPCRSRP